MLCNHEHYFHTFFHHPNKISGTIKECTAPLPQPAVAAILLTISEPFPVVSSSELSPSPYLHPVSSPHEPLAKRFKSTPASCSSAQTPHTPAALRR